MVEEPELAGVHTTALGAAAARGLHLLRDGDPKILRDIYAIPLTGWTEQQALNVAAAASLSSTATWVTRSRVAEDRLAEAMTWGVDQYVILGAGLDSFVWRYPELLHHLIVYEVDDPPMQSWKRRRLGQLGLAEPSGLRFVPCEFETQVLDTVLGEAGFVPSAPAVVSWLGVTQYLPRDAIAETSVGPDGSRPVRRSCSPTLSPALGPRQKRSGTRHAGRAFETFFAPDEIAAVLEAAGLRAEQITPEQLNETYVRHRDDGMQASTGERLAVGLVT
jgi:methyltransferase (TIGR00027 family)